VIQSVHAFQPSLIGSFFLAFLIVSIVAVVVLVLFRWRTLRLQVRGGGVSRAGNVLEYASEAPAAQMQGLVSREGAVLLGNTMLVFMMLLTLLGTVFPLISGLLSGNAISVKENFYNVAVLPLSIVTVVMMAAAPLLMYGSVPFSELLRKMRIPLAISTLATIIVTAMVLHGQMTWRMSHVLWTVLATFAIALTVSGIGSGGVLSGVTRVRPFAVANSFISASSAVVTWLRSTAARNKSQSAASTTLSSLKLPSRQKNIWTASCTVVPARSLKMAGLV
jgi:cytochrome c biogenesis factor